jgi:hypothetical protein
MICAMHRCATRGKLALLLILNTGILFLSSCGSEQPLPTLVVALSTLPAIPRVDPTIRATGRSLPATITVTPDQTAFPTDVVSPATEPVITASATLIIPSRTPTASPTATPTATATRYVSVIGNLPPTDELGPSKLGLHVVRNNDPNILEFVRKAQPAVMKAVDDLGFLAEVKAVSPRTITIGRHSVGSQDYIGNPEEAAQEYVEEYLDIFTANPAVDYWEGWNEPDPNLNNMIWYSRFEQERVRLMAQHGFRVAIGGFPTGVPEMDEFQLFLPAIDVAIQHGGILSLHEYSAPDMGYLYGQPLPGFQAYPDRGSLTFRYRWYYREYLEPAGLEIPLVVSEAGIDGIISNRPGPPGLGWRDFQTYWEEQGLGQTGVEAFINQLAWYDAGVRKDGYVIGFTVFTAGGFGYWENYNVNPILPEITDYAVGQG